jgi:hypothetical protein
MTTAREAFLDLMADAEHWHTETDEDGTFHTIRTVDRQLANLVAALGIAIRWGEPTEDAIQRAINDGPQLGEIAAAAIAKAVQS